MSARAWLTNRSAGVPPALRAALMDGAIESGNSVTENLMASAAHELSVVLSASPMTRDQALTLLTADAFATYAFEAATDDPSTIGARADAAMKLLAAQVRA